EHVPGLAVDRTGGIQRLQMSQEASGQVAVSAPPFLDNECGGNVGLFGRVVVVVHSQRVRQSVIGARHRLIVVPDLSPSEGVEDGDRKSTRLNSSHDQISYAVFCLKKKTNKKRN